jgi:hypothetical protein
MARNSLAEAEDTVDEEGAGRDIAKDNLPPS